MTNNTHAKISVSSLAESMPINPKQCRKLKLSAKFEIELIDRKTVKTRQNKMAAAFRGGESKIIDSCQVRPI